MISPMSDEFLEQITGLVPESVRTEQAELWEEVLNGWEQYFKDYHIEHNRQREEFDAIIRLRMASLVMSVAPPTDEEKGRTISPMNDEEVWVVNAEIDALMKEHGYTWDEPNMQYVNGEMTVSGDFASTMCLELKKAKSHARQIALEARIDELERLFPNTDDGFAGQIHEIVVAKRIATLKQKQNNAN